MFSKLLLAWVAILSVAFGSWNSVTSNYYIYAISTALNFPFPTGVCTPVEFAGKYAMYTCTSTSTMQIQYYTTSTCSNSSLYSTTYTNTSLITSVSAGTAGYFSCSGTDGSYAAVDISVAGCAATKTFYAALSACAKSLSGQYYATYCNSSLAELNYFNTIANCTSTGVVASTVVATSTCQSLFNVTALGIYVTGKYESCVTPTTTTTKASSGVMHYSAVSILLIALFNYLFN